ncbi:hypothetical protein KR044_010064, partial [Drosophila immigrans]
LGTLRQGNMPLLQYYDEVEKKLTLLITKVNMSYESALAEGLRNKFRDDALRVFVSGLKRNLTDVFFAAKPKDLPTALALAQEIESNHERYAFAANFAKSLEEKAHKAEQKTQGKDPKSNPKQSKSPNFKQQQGSKQNDQAQSKPNSSDTPEPMDVDPSSSKFRQQTAFSRPSPSGNNYTQNQKRSASQRTSGQGQRQRVDHITPDTPQAQAFPSYNEAATSAVSNIDSDADSDQDGVNF